MPTFSAANGTQFPDDVTYMPQTEVHPANAPEYAYYFYPQDDFEDHYNFDNCAAFALFNRRFTYTAIDFNHQDLYYRRLFRLKNIPRQPKFYLCPWLIVPFEAVAISTNAFQAKLSNFKLTVKPYSIYEGAISPKVKNRIASKNPNPLNGRTLELFSSGNGVNVSWKNPKPGSASTVIDELACVKAQTVNVTIDSASTVYDHSSYIEIRTVIDASTNSYATLGRVYLVFLEIIKRNAVFFDVQATPNSQTKIDIRMLGGTGAAQLAELQGKLTDLNTVYEMSGLKFEAPNMSITLDGVSSPLVTGGSITFDTGKTVNMTDPDQGPRIAKAFRQKITTVNGTTWTDKTNPYVFVFFIPITPVAGTFSGGAGEIGTVSGQTSTWSRTAGVFLYSRKTLTHELGHGLGLPHTFKDDSATYPEISGLAEAFAKILFLTSTKDLYLFYDQVNSIGLNGTLIARFGISTLSSRDEIFGMAGTVGAFLETRRYGLHLTDNLLDYKTTSNSPQRQEQLRKDQIEQMRFFI